MPQSDRDDRRDLIRLQHERWYLVHLAIVLDDVNDIDFEALGELYESVVCAAMNTTFDCESTSVRTNWE